MYSQQLSSRLRASELLQHSLYLLPVAPPVPLLGKDPSVVVEIDLLPQRDLLKLRPLKGAVRQLPSLLLRTARRHTSVKAALQEPT